MCGSGLAAGLAETWQRPREANARALAYAFVPCVCLWFEAILSLTGGGDCETASQAAITNEMGGGKIPYWRRMKKEKQRKKTRQSGF